MRMWSTEEVYAWQLTHIDDPCDDCTHWIGLL